MAGEHDGPRRWLLTIEGAMLEAIGRATVQFAHLEAELDYIVWSLVAGFDALSSNDALGARRSLEAQRVGQAITARLGFRSKTEIMVALATHRHSGRPDVLKVIDSLREGLDAAAKRRNRIVHSVWSGQGVGPAAASPGTAVSVKDVLVSREGMRQNVVPSTQEEVSGFADALAELAYKLAEVRHELLPGADDPGGGGAA